MTAQCRIFALGCRKNTLNAESMTAKIEGRTVRNPCYLEADIPAPTRSRIATYPALRTDPLPKAGLPTGERRTPEFFPAISSTAKALLSPLEHLRLVQAVSYPTVLVSAYDIARAQNASRTHFVQLLSAYRSAGGVVAVDSGAYESYWLRDQSWQHSEYVDVLRNTSFDIAFGLDAPPQTDANAIVAGTTRDREACNTSAVIPIVHARNHAEFPSLCKKVAVSLRASAIAVPERELGTDVVQGAWSLQAITAALTEVGAPVRLHILGAGNPISVLVYAAYGAHSFDGLDWCQTVASYSTATLHHSRQLPLFEHETPFSGDQSVSYGVRLLAHNLAFYSQWMSTIQRAISDRTIHGLLSQYLISSVVARLPRPA